MKTLKYVLLIMVSFIILVIGAMEVYPYIFEKDYNPLAEQQIDALLANKASFHDLKSYLSRNVLDSTLVGSGECENINSKRCSEQVFLVSFPVGRPSMVCNRWAFTYRISVSVNGTVAKASKQMHDGGCL